MRIKTLEIKNFRSLKEAKFEDLNNLVVLIGHSGSGKTSVFEALDLFFTHIGTPSAALNLNDRYWFDRVTSNPIIISTEILLDDSDFAGLSEPVIEWAQAKQKQEKSLALSVEIRVSTSRKVVWRLVKPNLSLLLADIQRSKPPVATPAGEPTQPVAVEKTSKEIELENWLSLLGNLVGQFQWIKGSRFTSELEAEEARAPYIPIAAQNQLLSLKNSDEAADVSTYATVRREFDQALLDGHLDYDNQSAVVYEGHTKYPVNLLGSGQQSFLFSLLEITKRGSVIIGAEEPETHLDPGLQKRLFDLLRDRKSQVFIISHSPLFIEKQQVECNWVLKKEGPLSTIQRLKTSSDLKKVLDNLGSRPSDTLHPNVVLMVEGETEEAHIPILLRKLGGKPDLPGLRVVRLHGKQDKQTAKAWIAMAKQTQTDVFLLLDNGAEELVKVATEAGLSDLNIQELRGTIEDTYPVNLVYEVLQETYLISKNPKKRDGQPVAAIDEKEARVKEINRYIKESIAVGKNDFWKIQMGISIAEKIPADEIDPSLRRFLGRVIASSAG